MEEQELADKILYHKKKYYDGEPEISDEEFDRLEDQMREINPDNHVLFLVGSPGGGKFPHDPPMLSSDKVNGLDQIIKWVDKIDGRSIYAGYKVDGFSLSLIYENGRLIKAGTRGNGQFGDDVTFAAAMLDIPKTIPHPGRVNIRGEGYMKISEFNRVNATLTEKFSNPRNLAVGTFKQKDILNLGKRELNFMAFDLIGQLGNGNNKSIAEIVKLLQFWGFNTADIKFIDTPFAVQLEEIYDEFTEMRNSLDFQTDGVIFKYNEYSDRLAAGETEHHPKWQVAWKFKSKGATTILKDITWQIGRTSILTPVAELEKVEVAGANISRATLHNMEFLMELKAAPGDVVQLERAGDVIPRVISVFEKGNNELVLPKNCPSCGSELITEGVNLVCTGDICRDRDIQSIIYFMRMVEIEGLGPSSVSKLYDAGLVIHYADLYKVSLDDMVRLLGKNGGKAFENILDSKNMPFNKFLAGLGIHTLGNKMGKVLANKFDSFDQLKNASLSDLMKIDGISDVTASSILKGVMDPDLGDRVLANGVELMYPEKKIASSGERVYVTGKIGGMHKKSVQEFVESKGFEWSSSISSKLSMLVYGVKAGQSKLDKAKQKNIKVLSWDEFKEYVENMETIVLTREELLTSDEFPQSARLTDYFEK